MSDSSSLRCAAPKAEKQKRVIRLPDSRGDGKKMSVIWSLKAREARMREALAVDFAALARKRKGR